MVSKVDSSTSLLKFDLVIGHSYIIALDADLCMDINEYQAILSVAI